MHQEGTSQNKSFGRIYREGFVYEQGRSIPKAIAVVYAVLGIVWNGKCEFGRQWFHVVAELLVGCPQLRSILLG